jgi:hypothetical protein
MNFELLVIMTLIVERSVERSNGNLIEKIKPVVNFLEEVKETSSRLNCCDREWVRPISSKRGQNSKNKRLN